MYNLIQKKYQSDRIIFWTIDVAPAPILPFNLALHFINQTHSSQSQFVPETEPANRPAVGDQIRFGEDPTVYTVTDIAQRSSTANVNVNFTPVMSDHSLVNQDVFRVWIIHFKTNIYI